MCVAPPSEDPAAQHYWYVHSVALHQNGSLAQFQSSAEANVDAASGTHVLVLTMTQGLKRETFSLRVHLECLGQDIVISQSTLTLVKGGSGGSGSGGSGSGGSGSGGSGSGGSGSGGSGSGSSGSGSGGSGAHCVVPRLVGKTLKAARHLLVLAHCRLGKVIVPKPRPNGALVVSATAPKAGARLPAGAKVNVTLRAP